MVTPMKIDSMAFSSHAEILRKEVAETYIKKAIECLEKNRITSEVRINSTARIFLEKAEEEFERRLHLDFPNPYYEPLISLVCIGSRKYFDKLQEKINISVNNALVTKT